MTASAGRRTRLGALLLTAVLAPSGVAQDSPDDGRPRLQGFRTERVAEQRALEDSARALISRERLLDTLLMLTERPRLAGTGAQRDHFIAQSQVFMDAGWTMESAIYKAWLPLPLEARVDLLAPVEAGPFPGPERDDPIQGGVMPHNAYGANGVVEGEIVYVNRGLPGDYAVLDELGIDVAGKVVLAKYGGSYRGVKVREAEQRGALGVVLYSDPADDGPVRGEVWPDGPWRPGGAVQRGSVIYGFLRPGDPLTPFEPAITEAERLDPADVEILPGIPCIPLGWRDAARLLEHLGGPAPESFAGGLPDVPYAVGSADAPVRVKLTARSNRRLREIANVVAHIPGRTYPERQVILGGHRDSWVLGAADNGSGTAALLELARVLGELVSRGWQPERTITIALWDAEEFNLIGSTEWVEQFTDELREKAVAYINVDSAATGTRFGASASPSLGPLVVSMARDVAGFDGASLAQQWLGLDDMEPVSDRLRKDLAREKVGQLGSGSDFGPFVQHAGVASIHVGFGGGNGIYHAAQDDMAFVGLVDPDMAIHERLTDVLLTLALRLSQADVPDFVHAQTSLRAWDAMRALEQSYPDRQGIDSAHGQLIADWMTAAMRMDIGMAELVEAGVEGPLLGDIADAFARSEQVYLDDDGLPGRPWFRHTLISTSTVDGYGSQPLPGLDDALAGRAGDVEEEQRRLLRVIDRAAERFDRLTDEFGAAGRAALGLEPSSR